MKYRLRLKPLDIAAIILSMMAVIFISTKVYSSQGGSLYVHITGQNGEWIEPLDKDKDIEVQGPLGSTKVRIQGGTAMIIDSPCSNKLCINMGAVSRTNQWIACLPNKVFVKIEGRTASEGQPDATAF